MDTEHDAPPPELIWLGVIAFVGCELSWLLSPFLCDPRQPPHIIARYYFDYNFCEYVWSALFGHA